MNEHLDTLIGLELCELPAQAAVDWAVAKLQAGCELESVNELAWAASPSRADALIMLRKAMGELGLPVPVGKPYKLAMARHIAKAIIAGTVDANHGCGRIAEINHELGWPDELSAFGALAHEQSGHENLGITAETVRPAIIEEARRLARET